MTIEWKDSYCIGDPLTDLQHQELFALANTMFDARNQADLRLCAIKLYKHVREHFSDEEKLMRRLDFPGYRAHVESHNAMLQGLSAISHGIGKNDIDTEVVATFLMDRALKHIPKDDAEVARHLKNHQIP